MNNTPKHTPGPWMTDGRFVAQSFRSGQPYIADCIISQSSRSIENTTANARLIAAAPCLLEALRECQVALHKSQRYGPAEHQANVLCALESAQEAIQKAEGL